jgi:hypothetical protein
MIYDWWRAHRLELLMELAVALLTCLLGTALLLRRRPMYFCNKCGYYGPVQVDHVRPYRGDVCNYYASEVKR